MKQKITAGSPVLCVGVWKESDPKLPFKITDIKIPEKGKDYTVREVVETKYGVGIRLEEIKNPEFFFHDIKREEEPIFDIKKFQPAKKKR